MTEHPSRALENLFVGQLGLNPWVIIILILLRLLMGTFLDDTTMLVIVAPPLCPSCQGAGTRSDLVWVPYTITCQIAYMTPPFGYKDHAGDGPTGNLDH